MERSPGNFLRQYSPHNNRYLVLIITKDFIEEFIIIYGINNYFFFLAKKKSSCIKIPSSLKLDKVENFDNILLPLYKNLILINLILKIVINYLFGVLNNNTFNI